MNSTGISRVPAYSGAAGYPRGDAHGAFTLHGVTFQSLPRLSLDNHDGGPITPATPRRRGFGLFPGRSPLPGESLLFSLPAVTGMFRFTAFARSLERVGPPARRVAPFGYPGIKGHLHLLREFRRLSRPSSPPRAKASTARPLFDACQSTGIIQMEGNLYSCNLVLHVLVLPGDTSRVASAR